MQSFGIRHRLIGLVIITVLPVVFFSTALLKRISDHSIESIEANMLGTTRALNTAIDEQIVTVVSSLKILSEVEDFHPSLIQYLHSRIRRFVRKQKEWEWIAFVDTNGNQIFNSSEPFGKKLPSVMRPSFREMLESGKITVSGRDVITVSVPVKKDGKVIYALIGAQKLDAFQKILTSQIIPEDWSVTILDTKARTIAKSGKHVDLDLSGRIKWGGSHLFTLTTKNGDRYIGANTHSKVTGWTTVLTMPDNTHATFFYLLCGGVGLLMSSILLAIYFGRKISGPVLILSQKAKSMGRGEPVGELDTNLLEVKEVHEALKEASQLRNLAEENIKQAVTIRDTFLSVASHELKTPITTLKLQFQLLDRSMKKQESIPRSELKRSFKRIQDQVKRLVLLVDDLLDVSKITAGKVVLHPEDFDMVTFITEVVQQFEGQVPITVTGIDTLSGRWDRHRLEQVVVNLITNALKYGNGKPVTVDVMSDDQEAVIRVADQGMGISEENLPKIFERFERVGDTKSIAGLGLGLWIVRKILECLGGTISVTSKLGEGSTFEVRVPLQKEITAQDVLTLDVSAEEEALVVQ